MERYDAVVVGVGGMGSAALYHLARRGRRVLGLERFEVPNDRGSSHGLTRIIRLAHFEDPSYVLLVRRAYELWHELESAAGEQLLHATGAIDAGGQLFEGSLRSCLEHGLPHEVLDGAALGRRFPGYRLPPDLPVLLQPDGGFLLPERCVAAYARAAVGRGAELRTGERVVGWAETDDGVLVRTERGSIGADRLVLTAGAWSRDVARLPPGLVGASRQSVLWFAARRPELFTPDRFPVFNLEIDEEHVYGFPEFGVPGVKIGRYDRETQVVADPDRMSRRVAPSDEATLRPFVERYLPDAAGRVVDVRICPFDPSPDEDFIIDRHPESDRVVLAAGFSGRGFKFCSVVGEILADLALDGVTGHDVDRLRLDRFGDERLPAGNRP